MYEHKQMKIKLNQIKTKEEKAYYDSKNKHRREDSVIKKSYA